MYYNHREQKGNLFTMATPAIPDDTKELILADFKTGDFTQRHLSQKYKLSLGAINKLTKGVDKSTAHIVNNLVQSKQALSQLDERTVNAVNEVVDSKVKWLEYLNRQALKNVQDSFKAPCVEQVDFKHRADTISKAKEVLVGKNSDVSVQVNTQVNSQLTPNEFEDIAIRLLNR